MPTPTLPLFKLLAALALRATLGGGGAARAETVMAIGHLQTITTTAGEPPPPPPRPDACGDESIRFGAISGECVPAAQDPVLTALLPAVGVAADTPQSRVLSCVDSQSVKVTIFSDDACADEMPWTANGVPEAAAATTSDFDGVVSMEWKTSVSYTLDGKAVTVQKKLTSLAGCSDVSPAGMVFIYLACGVVVLGCGLVGGFMVGKNRGAAEAEGGGIQAPILSDSRVV